jgi:hypothetical protein
VVDIARHARHLALPEIGPEGQARISAARVAVVGTDVAADTAALYLKAAGVHQLFPRPAKRGEDQAADTQAWFDFLSNVDLVVRSGFDDDAMLGTAARLGLPVIVVRAQRDGVDMVSFAHRPPAPDAAPASPYAAATPADNGPAAVLAGTLAAAEALHVLARGRETAATPPIRHLRLPLDGREPTAQAIGRQP